MPATTFKKILFVSLICFVIAVPAASAHVLKTDGTIGVVMHIDPDDDPVAGQPATIYFIIADTTNKFQFQNCNCTIAITEQNKQPVTSKLSQPQFAYTFPETNVYNINFSGIPTGGSFQSFSVSYTVRVDQQSVQSPASKLAALWFEHWLHVVFFGGAIAANVFVFIKAKKAKKYEKIS